MCSAIFTLPSYPPHGVGPPQCDPGHPQQPSHDSKEGHGSRSRRRLGPVRSVKKLGVHMITIRSYGFYSEWTQRTRVYKKHAEHYNEGEGEGEGEGLGLGLVGECEASSWGQGYGVNATTWYGLIEPWVWILVLVWKKLFWVNEENLKDVLEYFCRTKQNQTSY